MLPSQPLDTSINDGSYVDGPLVAPDESFLIFESDRPGEWAVLICTFVSKEWAMERSPKIWAFHQLTES